MKAFLLAAGAGTRLKPLTDCMPKCLVPIQGVPMLAWWLEWCHRYGVAEVLINTHAHADAVEHYVSSHDFGVKIMVARESKLLGSAGTIWQNRQFVGGEREFAVLYADVLTSCNFTNMVAFHRERQPAVTLGVYRVPDPSRCGIVGVDRQGWVTEFIEKPKRPKDNLAFSGLMIGGPALFEVLGDRFPADIGSDVLPRLVGRMCAYEMAEFVLDVGTAENYRRAQSEWRGSLLVQGA